MKIIIIALVSMFFLACTTEEECDKEFEELFDNPEYAVQQTGLKRIYLNTETNRLYECPVEKIGLPVIHRLKTEKIKKRQ